MASWTQTLKDKFSKKDTYLGMSTDRLGEKSSRTSASDEDTLAEDGSRLLGEDGVYRIYGPQRRRFGTVAAISSVVVVGLSTFGGFLAGRTWQPNLDLTCMKQSSTYSTVMHEVNTKLHEVKFNGTLGKNSEFSGDLGDPNEEMDRNWNHWGFVKYASFSEEEFAAMGMDLEGSAKFTPEYGGGYIGFLEVSHKMHCLNVIRQAYHREYYDLPENREWADWLGDHPKVIKKHINHCFEMLRQNIMCSADIGVISHHWVEGDPDPFANFNTVHKCRDLDSIDKWIQDHVVPMPPPGGHYPRPLDAKVWPTPP